MPDSSSSATLTAASKAKDLSHVPCKFYKVGGCTAGASCPFSHSSVEPGGQKETCAWFVKGNCKFGHKCALAHILPGQSMAMDRKNKKAAQVAAAGANGKEPKLRMKREVQSGTGSSGGAAAPKNQLLPGGPTAPTRLTSSGQSVAGPPSSGRHPMAMPLKATISPSAPAPVLRDADFSSFVALDEIKGVQPPSAPVQGNELSSSDQNDDDTQPVPQNASAHQFFEPSVDPPSQSDAPNASANPSSEFGPIGSPSGFRSRPSPSQQQLNGNADPFSPSSSPLHQTHGSRSFSARGANQGYLPSSTFSVPDKSFATAHYGQSRGVGIASSLGSMAIMGGRSRWGDESPSASMTGYGSLAGRGAYDSDLDHAYGRNAFPTGMQRKGREFVVEDEDLEDFLPSSLNDLLTPLERRRRMSRSTSGQGASMAVGGAKVPTLGVNGVTISEDPMGESGHRYSRSVPAPSLLGDLKSIWADTSTHPLPSSPMQYTPSSSFAARYDHHKTNKMNGVDEVGFSGSLGANSSLGMMSPSNASAAFLPGLHRHYMDSKAKQAQQQQFGLGQSGTGRGLRGASGGPLVYPSQGGMSGGNHSLASNYMSSMAGLSSSVASSSGMHTHTHGNTQHSYRAAPSPFDLTAMHHQNQIKVQHNNNNHMDLPRVDDRTMSSQRAISRNTHALQLHAPGQSLPQGLAAGYSRIHALPPLPTILSPTQSGSFVGDSGGMPSSPSPSMQQNNKHHVGGVSPRSAAMEPVFERLSYSAAALRGTAPLPMRNGNGAPQLISPLGGLVVTENELDDGDEDLFSMDG